MIKELMDLKGPRDIVYTIRLHGKYNFIIGDTASGKTHLADFVEMIRRNSMLAGIQPCLIAGRESYIHTWANEKDALIVLDEKVYWIKYKSICLRNDAE